MSVGTLLPLKNYRQSMKVKNLQSVMCTIAYIMQCTNLTLRSTPKPLVEQIKRIREEGYTALDMLKCLFHLKDNKWTKEFQ